MNPINHDDLIKLNERLDHMLSSDKALEAAAESKSSLFRAAAELSQAEHPQVSDAMRERMRAKMLQAMPQTAAAEVKPQKAILRPQFKVNAWAVRVAAIVLVLLFVGLATPPALASSLPGDALYPVKRGLETVELAFAGDYLGQVSTHLNLSERRLDESEKLLAKERFDSTVMDDALGSLEAAIRIANDHNLFTEHPELESRASATFSKFEQTLVDAEAADLVESSEVARLEESQNVVMGFLPSEMADPSSSSEVVTTSTQAPEAATEDVERATEDSSDVAAAAETVVVEGETLYVNADGNVNVREGAGTAYPVIARLTPNSPVTSLASSGDWTQVRLADGREGWVANFLLGEEPMPVETPDTTTAGTDEPTGGTSSSVTGGTSGTGGGGSGSTSCTGGGRSCEAPGHGGTIPGSGNSGSGNNGSSNSGNGNKR
jgi:uncharacterized membrane protein YgcG